MKSNWIKEIGIKKLISTGALVLSMAFLPILAAFATADVNPDQSEGLSSIKTVYHVYVGKVSIGTVDDPSLVTSEESDLIDQARSVDSHTAYMINPEVTMVSEQTFDPAFNNQKVLTALKDTVQAVPAEVSLVINGTPIAYLDNLKQADQVIQQFAEQFVSSDLAKQVVENEKADSEVLSNGETSATGTTEMSANSNSNNTILGLSFKQTVEYKKVPLNEAPTSDVSTVVEQLTKGDLVNGTYQISEGDTLGGIAAKFNLDLDELLALNPGMGTDSLINVGQPIVVKKPAPYLDLQLKQKVTKTVSIPYTIKKQQTKRLYKGESRTVQKGQDGEKKVTYVATIVNGKTVDKKTLEEQTITDPTQEVVEVGTKIISSRGTGQFAWPTVGGIITSPYGPRWGTFHKGIDIAGVYDSSILAADNGVVTFAGWDSGGYGKRIVINHNNGYETTYNHLSEIDVTSGQVVRKGQTIGVMGETGEATGVHLHFEVYKNGHLQNPAHYVHR